MALAGTVQRGTRQLQQDAASSTSMTGVARPTAGRPPSSQNLVLCTGDFCATGDALSETPWADLYEVSISKRHPSESFATMSREPIGQAHRKADEIVRSNDSTEESARVPGEGCG